MHKNTLIVSKFVKILAQGIGDTVFVAGGLQLAPVRRGQGLPHAGHSQSRQLRDTAKHFNHVGGASVMKGQKTVNREEEGTKGVRNGKGNTKAMGGKSAPRQSR